MTKTAKQIVPDGEMAIAEIRAAGFKSISEEQRIEVRPLTILAGANSSGKSSMMQPLLLLKQTLEASYNPGTLLLNGPNVKFTSADQLLARIGRGGHSLDSFHVGMRLNTGEAFQTLFRKEHKMGFRIERMEISGSSGSFVLWPRMSEAEIIKTGVTKGKELLEKSLPRFEKGRWEIKQDRCFLGPAWVAKGSDDRFRVSVGETPSGVWEGIIPEVIHLPGLRGNPERTYPVTAVGPSYPGTFEKYTASNIAQWMAESEDALAELSADLKSLKLAGGVSAVRVNDVQIELQVGRLPDIPPERPED